MLSVPVPEWPQAALGESAETSVGLIAACRAGYVLFDGRRQYLSDKYSIGSNPDTLRCL